MNAFFPIPRAYRSDDIALSAGATETGARDWIVFDPLDVRVFWRPEGAVLFVLVDPSDYTVEPAFPESGWPAFPVITDFPARATAGTMRIRGNRLYERTIAVTLGGTINGGALEREFGRMTVTLQELRRDLDDVGDIVAAKDAAEDAAERSEDARDEAVNARNDVTALYLGELEEDPADKPGPDGDAVPLVGGEWYVRPDGTQRVYSSGDGWGNAPQGPEGPAGENGADGEGIDLGWLPAESLPTDGTTNAVTALQAAIDAAPDDSVLVIPPGDYAIKSLPVDPSAYWVADGDGAIDTTEMAALAIRDRKGLTIIAFGVRFLVDSATADGYVFYGYRSQGCKIIGGEFVGDTTLVAGAGEASAIVWARCLDCWGEANVVDRFYRNLFGYRSAFSGFRNCRSTRGGYFNIYLSGALDITIPGALAPPTGSSQWLADNCFMQGGKYSNGFGEFAHFNNCTSVDAGRQGVPASHYRCDSQHIHVTGGSIVETSDQNSGGQVDGIQIASTSNFAPLGAYPTGSKVVGVRIRGCFIAINTLGANDTLISGCDIRDFYAGGILAISRTVGADNYELDGIQIVNNNVGPFNAASTVSPAGPNTKACIELNANNSVVCKGVIAGNVIDSNNGGAFTPSGTSYEVATNLSGANLAAGNNLVRGTRTNQLPAAKKTLLARNVSGGNSNAGATIDGANLRPAYATSAGVVSPQAGALSGTYLNIGGTVANNEFSTYQEQ